MDKHFGDLTPCAYSFDRKRNARIADLPTLLTANLLFKDACFTHSIQLNFNEQHQIDSKKLGGGERDRTDDPLLAKQVLSQLSYTPRCFTTTIKTDGGSGWARTIDPRLIKTVL
jgi:hypothetical protein